MKITELKELLKEGVQDIEFEDYEGNTLFWLSDLCYADSDTNEKGEYLRLQREEK